MEIEDLVRVCEIRLEDDGKLHARNREAKKHMGEIKAKRPEILAYCTEEKKKKDAKEAAEKVRSEAARKAKQAKIDAIEGLKELEDAIEDSNRYAYEFREMMDDEYNDGARPPKPAKGDVGALKKQYPRAAAYVKAQNWSFAANFVKADAGKKALNRIINGEDYEVVLADMQKEFDDYCKEHIWD